MFGGGGGGVALYHFLVYFFFDHWILNLFSFFSEEAKEGDEDKNFGSLVVHNGL